MQKHFLNHYRYDSILFLFNSLYFLKYLSDFEKTFLDLPWQDVLWKQVLPYLSIKDLFSLRLVNSHCKRLSEGYFSSLKQLDISTVSDQITLTAFNIIIENTQNLTSLNLKNCTQCANEDTLVYLIERNTRLSKVSFKNCNALSDCVLLTLSTNCLHLTHLNLSHCTWLHNVGLVTIAFKCHSLKYLNISSCFNITDESIRILVFNCHKLVIIFHSSFLSLFLTLLFCLYFLISFSFSLSSSSSSLRVVGG